MPKNDASAALKEKILMLEIQQAEERKILKEQFFEAYESLKPINLIKGVFREMNSSVEIRSNLFSSLLNVLTGYFTKKIVLGSTPNLFKKMAAILLQYGVTAIISKCNYSLRRHEESGDTRRN